MSKFGVAVIFLLLPLITMANGLLVFDPSNFFKNALSAKSSVSSLVNQAKQLKNEINMLEYQAKNSKSLAASEFRDISAVLNEAMAITKQGKAISYQMKDLDRQFQQQFPNYTKQQSVNYQQAYDKWNQSTLDTLSKSLQSIGIVVSNADREQQLLQKFKQHTQSSSGQLQALQTLNEVNTESIQQLQSLKHIIAAQANSQTAFMAQQVSQETFEQNSVSELVGSMPSEFPVYQNNPALGQISMGSN